MQASKDLVVSVAIQILSTAKTQDIPSIVSSLSVLEQDQLLKYIYKGFQNPQVYNAAVLLAWHEKVSYLVYDVRLLRLLGLDLLPGA